MPEPSSGDREVLPIPDRPYEGPIFEDAKDPAATFPPIEPLRPPEGAPNVLIVLLDDAGFGCSSAFGGPCRTPTAERLATGGLKFSRFHTTALCSEIPAGTHQVRMEFTYDGDGLGKGGDVSLYVDGAKAGDGRVEGTVPMLFSGDETCDVGSDTASPVSDDYTSDGSRFTGEVEWVQIDIDDSAEDLDHLISPEERLKIAMTRQ